MDKLDKLIEPTAPIVRRRLYLFDTKITTGDLVYIKQESCGKTLVFDPKLFYNRDPDTVMVHRPPYTQIALNLQCVDQFEWYRLNHLLIREQDFIIVCVCNGSRKQQWVKEIRPHIIIKYRDLCKAKITIDGDSIVNALTMLSSPDTFFSKLRAFLKKKLC